MSDPLLSARDLALVDAIAERVLELLDERPDATRVASARSPLVSAGELAEILGRSREWVYQHADELGGRRFGDGSRPRLWFDADVVMSGRQSSSESEPADPPAAVDHSRGRRRRRTGSGAELLPIGGRRGQVRS